MRLNLFAILTCFGLSLYSYAQAPIVSKDVNQQISSFGTAPVVVILKDQYQFDKQELNNLSKEAKSKLVYSTLTRHAAKSQQALIQYLSNKRQLTKSLFLVNAILAEIDLRSLNYLVQQPEVSEIVWDQTAKVHFQTDQISYNGAVSRDPELTWGNSFIAADTVWSLGYEGQGAVVGGADTGYQWDVSGIKSRYRGYITDSTAEHAYNWHDAIHTISPLSGDSINPCGLSVKFPCDDNGHGTHTMGTMVGKTVDFLYGVAPKAKWIGCRNMERGNGSPATYIECFEWFLAPTDDQGLNPKPELAPHVINNSWYCSESEGCNPSNFMFMETAIKNLKDAGIVVVVSAGNFGSSNCGTIFSPPAIFEDALVVGSIRDSGYISGFSSIGPVLIDSSNRIKPNVTAPGSEVLSQLKDGSYAAWSGTSMAGPHVAGLVALIVSANPALAGKVDQIKDIIEASAIKTNAHLNCGIPVENIPNNSFGHGIIHAYFAVKQAVLLKSEDPKLIQEFSVSPNPSSGLLTLIGNHNAPLDLYVYNQLGILIKSFNSVFMKDEIDVRSLHPGMYVLKTNIPGVQTKFLKL